MRTMILSGSPKGNVKNSASYFLARAFVSEMKDPCEILSIAKTDFNEITSCIADYDHVIFFMPNYVHAMPGIVMKFLEVFPKASDNKRSLGFVVQAGYMESIEEEIVFRYFEGFTKRLGYNYLGCAAKGEAAGIAIFPEKFKKVAKKFAQFGKRYEETGIFDSDLIAELSKPYELSKPLAGLLTLINKTGLGDLGWNMMLKKHNAFERRFDKPYLYHD